MKKAGFAVAALTAAAASLAGPYDVSTLWKSGDGGNAVYRIPALCTTPGGTLVAVCDARRDNGGDLDWFQPIRTSVRLSDDGGATWSPAKYTWDWPWDDNTRLSASDPSLICDAKRGKLHLFINVWDWSATPSNGGRGDGIYRFFVQESSDGGKTWGKPREISQSLAFSGWNFGGKRSEGGLIFVTSGSGIATSSGTLLHTLANASTGANAIFGSDDGGVTWKTFGTPVAPGDECKVVELPSGMLQVNSRWRGGGRQIHETTDGGRTWTSRYDAALQDPQCNGQIMRYGDSLLFSNCKSPTRRALLHLRASVDGGRTWSEGLCIEPHGAAYSDMAILPDGSVAVLYEGAGYATIRCARIPKEKIMEEIARAPKPAPVPAAAPAR